MDRIVKASNVNGRFCHFHKIKEAVDYARSIERLPNASRKTLEACYGWRFERVKNDAKT